MRNHNSQTYAQEILPAAHFCNGACPRLRPVPGCGIDRRRGRARPGDSGFAVRSEDTLPIEHKHYIDKHGQDLSEIRNWKWSGTELKEETASGEGANA